MVYNNIIYTPRTGHAVIEHGGLFYLFAGADSDIASELFGAK